MGSGGSAAKGHLVTGVPIPAGGVAGAEFKAFKPKKAVTGPGSKTTGISAKNISVVPKGKASFRKPAGSTTKTATKAKAAAKVLKQTKPPLKPPKAPKGSATKATKATKTIKKSKGISLL